MRMNDLIPFSFIYALIYAPIICTLPFYASQCTAFLYICIIQLLFYIANTFLLLFCIFLLKVVKCCGNIQIKKGRRIHYDDSKRKKIERKHSEKYYFL